MSTNQLDLLGQYISQVLIPRLNYADKLYKEGRYYEALLGLKSVIRVLVRRSDNEENTLREWLKRIDAINMEVKQIKGETKAGTVWLRTKASNLMARDLYEELEFEIWSRLHQLGYFRLGRIYGPDLKTIDLSDAEEQ